MTTATSYGTKPSVDAPNSDPLPEDGPRDSAESKSTPEPATAVHSRIAAAPRDGDGRARGITPGSIHLTKAASMTVSTVTPAGADGDVSRTFRRSLSSNSKAETLQRKEHQLPGVGIENSIVLQDGEVPATPAAMQQRVASRGSMEDIKEQEATVGGRANGNTSSPGESLDRTCASILARDPPAAILFSHRSWVASLVGEVSTSWTGPE